MNRDTSPEAERVLFAYLREAPAWEKWHRMAQLNHAARSLALAGLRRRYPTAPEAEIRRRLADLILSPELAARVYGPLPAGSTDA
jgi:hypothetical protein